MYYLKLSRNITLSFLFFLLVGTFVNAQCNFPIVATNCVGACGNPTQINYTALPCTSVVSNYCVVNESSSLCPSHNVNAFVFVNGTLVTSGNITAVGSGLNFTAICGSNIQVVAFAFPVGGGIACLWLGNLNYSLRRQ